MNQSLKSTNSVSSSTDNENNITSQFIKSNLQNSENSINLNKINLNKIYICNFNSLDFFIIGGNLYIMSNDYSLIDLSSILQIKNIKKDIKNVEEITNTNHVNHILNRLKIIYKDSYVIHKRFTPLKNSNGTTFNSSTKLPVTDNSKVKNTEKFTSISKNKNTNTNINTNTPIDNQYNSFSSDHKKIMKSNKKKVKDIEIDFGRKKIYLIFENSRAKNNAVDYILYPYYTKNGYNIFNNVIIKNNNKKEKKTIEKINKSGNVIIYTIDGEEYNKNSIEKFDPKKHTVKNKYKREGYIYGKSFKVGDIVYLATDKKKEKYIVKKVPIIGNTIDIKRFTSTSNTLQSADKEILHHYDILKVGDIVRVNSDKTEESKTITSEKKTGIPGRDRKTVYELNDKKGLWYNEDSLTVVNSKKINKSIKYENKPIKKVEYKGALKEVEKVIKPPRYSLFSNILFKLKGIEKLVPEKNITNIIYNNGPKKGIISSKSSASLRRT